MRKFVILGGGYGGLAMIEGLVNGNLPADIEIVLVDRMPFQGIKTEYYALAAGTASDFDLRIQFPQHNQLTKRYGEVTSIDLEKKLVHMDQDEPIEYDYLAIALGCTDRYHGIPGAEEYTNSIQTFSSTRKTYQRLNDIKPYGQVHIIGGGLSGVETAAELRESRPDLNITILDRGSRVLSAFPSTLSAYVEQWFRDHDVNTRSHISVSRVEQGAVYNGDEAIYTDAAVWTGGIQLGQGRPGSRFAERPRRAASDQRIFAASGLSGGLRDRGLREHSFCPKRAGCRRPSRAGGGSDPRPLAGRYAENP